MKILKLNSPYPNSNNSFSVASPLWTKQYTCGQYIKNQETCKTFFEITEKDVFQKTLNTEGSNIYQIYLWQCPICGTENPIDLKDNFPFNHQTPNKRQWFESYRLRVLEDILNLEDLSKRAQLLNEADAMSLLEELPQSLKEQIDKIIR